MTVLYFADTRFPIERANGVQTMETCRALARRGHHVRLIVRPDTASPARDPFAFYGVAPEPSLTVVEVRGHSGAPARIRYLLSALATVRDEPDAVVYTRDLGVASVLLQLPRLRRPRLVYESHGIAPVVSAELPKLLGQTAEVSRSKLTRLDRRERRVWRRASAYVTITRALAEDLETRYGRRDHVVVAPDGAAPPSAEPVAGSPVTMGYAGHLYPWKGVDVFVRALARLPEATGLIVGGHPREADRERLEALAESLGIAKRLEITGLVARADVARHLARASVLVLPNTESAISERYTSPLKLFEYLWMAKPIIASDLASIREVLTDRQTAWLVPPGNVDALAAAVGALEADPEQAARLGRGAAALAPSFTWDRRAERLERALDGALASR